MEFKKVDYNNIRQLMPFLYKCDYGLCDYAPMVLLLWGDFFDYHFALNNGALFLRQTRNGRHEYLLPISDDLEGALVALKSWLDQKGEELRLVAIPQAYVERVVSVLGVDTQETGQEDFDYVYLASDLAGLVGRKYNGQRNHVNRFKRDNPNAVFRALLPSDKPAIEDFLRQYHLNDDSETYLYDVKSVKIFTEKFDEFDFLGGACFCDEKIVAFAFGDKIGDTLFVHVEKCLRSYSGVGETINRSFVACFADERTVFVNREEDMGDLGMRKAKLSYYPILRKKYKTTD